MKLLKRAISACFGLFGLKIGRTETYNNCLDHLEGKYTKLVAELEACFREIIFRELPPCAGRIELLAQLLGTQASEALYILTYLHKSLKLEGEVCEFGVAQGTTSALLANEIRSTEKNLYLFDSFEGLPKPDKKDLLLNDIFNLGSIENYTGKMSCAIEMVESRLKAISFPSARVKIIPGFIKETINCNQDLPQKICFAYLDFDFYEPTLTTLKFLDKNLSAGGFVIIDDYNFFSSGIKTAIDEFLKGESTNYETILPLKFSGHFCILRKIDK